MMPSLHEGKVSDPSPRTEQRLVAHRVQAPDSINSFPSILHTLPGLTGQEVLCQGTSARVHSAVRLEEVDLMQVEVTGEPGGETLCLPR
jgi:hypothetical protein